MNIQIHSLKFDADKKLLDFVTQKVNKLSLVTDDIVSAEIILKLEKDEERENKVTEIRVEYPKGPLFARKQSKTFEEATDHVIAALKRQIVKQKGKMRGE
ncbi:MAG TPA: ribosome-associated translation inhibitor RaiA [Bacteroidales bacterium]|jgi:putative sigma-54 modulation protein|nr:ribosome-associated translation inhibitor RaiA [Bacteroidales bacterium]